MKSSTVFVYLVAFLATGPLLAAGDPSPPRVRGLDCWANETLERGVHRSPLIRSLIAAIEASDLIVHLETSTTLPSALSGMTRLVAGAGDADHRYVRVTLDRDLQPNERAAVLAHELQHAVELAETPVRTVAAVLALYQRIGVRVGGAKGYWETMAAQQVGARARVELRSQARMTIQR